jgi:hypothetical protein
VRTSWLRVEWRISRTFDADHSLPQMGQPERHRHSYWVGFGYTQEINPATGSAKCSVAKLLQDADACVALVREKYLKGAMTGIRSPARWAAGWCLASTLIARRSGETELDARAKRRRTMRRRHPPRETRLPSRRFELDRLALHSGLQLHAFGRGTHA